MDALRSTDHALAEWVYGLGLPELPTVIVTHLATRGGVWLLVGLALVVFGRGGNRRTGAAVCVGLAVHIVLIEMLLKNAVARTRPFAALGLGLRDTLVNPDTYSFPSGHAVASFMGAWILGARFPRWRLPLVGVAALVAVSRVALGAHYPADVTAGALIGLVLAAALVRIFRIRPRPTPAVVEQAA